MSGLRAGGIRRDRRARHILRLGFGRIAAHHRRQSLALAIRRFAGVHHALLFMIERREYREPLRRGRGHERDVVGVSHRLVHFAHAVPENLLLRGTVAIGDHERHERAGFCRLRTGCLGGGKNGFRDLVEVCNILSAEISQAPLECGICLLDCGQQAVAADECDSAQQGADAANRLASIDQLQLLSFS